MARVVPQAQSAHHLQRRQACRTGDSHRGSSTRTDGHDTLGRRTEPGLGTPVSNPGDADGGSGTPYRASGRSTAVDVPKVQSSDDRREC